jgi:hypothetical protein
MAPTDAGLDERILFFTRVEWLKVARVLGDVRRDYSGKGNEISDATLQARLRALIDDGRLEGAGDVSRWRHSEVRRVV